MSYDRLLDQVCPHIVVEEALFLSADRQTVRPLRPISAISSVKLRLNGELEVPAPGHHIPAQATGSKSGPFKIQGGVNDQLVVKVGDGSYQTIKAPSGNNLSAIQVADYLNRNLRGASFSVTPKKQLRLSSVALGPEAILYLRTSGSTLAGVLGLNTNRAWRGQTIAPGWSVVNDPNTLLDRPTRLIVFDRPLKGFEDYVELDYATINEECRRCGGLGIENDWRYGSQGQVVKAINETLLEQELLKISYTVQGSNPFHTWYGTNIVNTIGRKLSSSGIIQNMIITDFYEAFRRWQSIKRQQEEVVGQLVTDEEYPFRLLSVSLQQSESDPTIIFITCNVQSRSNKPIQIERGIRTPFGLLTPA